MPDFGSRVSVTFHLTCVHVIFSSVWEWSPLGQWLTTRLTICSLCILTACNILIIYVFGFKVWIWVLIASVPDQFAYFYFQHVLCTQQIPRDYS